MVEPVDTTGASQSDPDTSQGRGGTQDPAAPGHVYRASRRTQETKQEKGEAPANDKGLSAETIAIMVTVLLGLASYGPNGGLQYGITAQRIGGSSDPLPLGVIVVSADPRIYVAVRRRHTNGAGRS